MVKHANPTQLSDVKLTPQWHQWLRHTRDEPPSLQDQRAEIQRQAQLKHNAALADARWAAKAKYIEKPKPAPEQIEGAQNNQQQARPQEPSQIGENPGSNYQPEAWTPGVSGR
jgi:NADH dehydrogenase [ubiquinone] 1 alpha subcomplex assembly factor 2